MGIKLGVRGRGNKEVVVVVKKEGFGLGVDVINGVVVKSYNKGGKEGVERLREWRIVEGKVISLGDKG